MTRYNAARDVYTLRTRDTQTLANEIPNLRWIAERVFTRPTHEDSQISLGSRYRIVRSCLFFHSLPSARFFSASNTCESRIREIVSLIRVTSFNPGTFI